MKKIKNNLVIISILVSINLMLGACGQNNRQASPKIKDSFSTAANNPKNAEGFRVAIKKSALEKNFLLQGNLIIQDSVPMFNGLKSRVVRFELLGDKLAMFESAEGQSLSSSHPPKLLLAVFSIKENTADEIAFDFAGGMSQLFYAADWYASDFAGGEYYPQFEYLPVNTSVVQKVSYLSDSTMVIRQIAQLPAGITFTNTVEVDYYLSPYQTNVGFTPSETTNFERMGFFEVAPQLTKDENMVTYASKWDARKKIRYGLSANTPEEYKQAIKDGILYWNQILGEDSIEVVDASAELKGPDASINMIEWVKWDYAGFAYADAQMDPLTGEILHSQIFLTSAFAFGAKEQAKAILAKQSSPQTLKNRLSGFERKTMKADKQSLLQLKNRKGAEKKKIITLKNFTQNHLCYRDESQRLQKILTKVLSKNLSDEKVLSIAQDYIREVVAHEVGHTLGLRHNFAGSLSTNYSLAEREHLFNKYISNGEVDSDIHSSSSVMDYQEFEEAVFTGDKIERRTGALAYDQKAIAALYRGQKFDNLDIPLFCTDSHMMMGYVDCAVFDAGSSALAFAKHEVVKSPDELAQLLATIFVYLRANANNLDDAIFTDDLAAYLNIPKLGVMISMMYDQFPYLSIERKFPRLNSSSMPDFLKLSQEYVEGEVANNGGASDVIPSIPADVESMLYSKTLAFLENPEFVKALNQGDLIYLFSDAEKAKFAEGMQPLLETLAVASMQWEVYLFSIVEEFLQFVPAPSGKAFSDVYAAKLTQYLTASSNKIQIGKTKLKLLAGGTKKVSVSLPVFDYSNSFRKVAATGFRAMGTQLFSSNATDASQTAATSLKQMATKALGGVDPLLVDTSSISDPRLAAWVQDVAGILTDLSQDTYSMDGSL